MSVGSSRDSPQPWQGTREPAAPAPTPRHPAKGEGCQYCPISPQTHSGVQPHRWKSQVCQCLGNARKGGQHHPSHGSQLGWRSTMDPLRAQRDAAKDPSQLAVARLPANVLSHIHLLAQPQHPGSGSLGRALGGQLWPWLIRPPPICSPAASPTSTTGTPDQQICGHVQGRDVTWRTSLTYVPTDVVPGKLAENYLISPHY